MRKTDADKANLHNGLVGVVLLTGSILPKRANAQLLQDTPPHYYNPLERRTLLCQLTGNPSMQLHSASLQLHSEMRSFHGAECSSCTNFWPKKLTWNMPLA